MRINIVKKRSVRARKKAAVASSMQGTQIQLPPKKDEMREILARALYRAFALAADDLNKAMSMQVQVSQEIQ